MSPKLVENLGEMWRAVVDISDACLISEIDGTLPTAVGAALASPACYCDATQGVDVLTPRDCLVINLGQDSARHAQSERSSFQLFKMPKSATARRYGARLVTAEAEASPSHLVKLQSWENALFEVMVETLDSQADSRTLIIYSTADDVRETVTVRRSEETRPYFDFLEVLGELEKFDGSVRNDYFATFHMVQREAYRCFEARGYGEFVLDGICREAAGHRNFAVELASVRAALLDVIPLVRQVSPQIFRHAHQKFAALLPLASTFMFAPVLNSEADLPPSGRVRQPAPGSAQDLPFAIAMLDRLEDAHIEALYRDVGEAASFTATSRQKSFHLAGLAYQFARQNSDRFRKLVDGLNQLVSSHLIAAVSHR